MLWPAARCGASWALVPSESSGLVNASRLGREFATATRIEEAVRECTRTESADRPTFDELLALLRD